MVLFRGSCTDGEFRNNGLLDWEKKRNDEWFDIDTESKPRERDDDKSSCNIRFSAHGKEAASNLEQKNFRKNKVTACMAWRELHGD